MRNHYLYTGLVILFTAVVAIGLTGLRASGLEASSQETNVAQQIALLEDSCKASAVEREQRQTDEPLYFRLGGYDRIRRLTGEIVRLHLLNDSIKHLFQGINLSRLADLVADFMAAGSGGPQEYGGRDMRAAHGNLRLTNAHFLAAGSDVGQAMQNLEYSQAEIDEVVCILVSLRNDVVRH